MAQLEGSYPIRIGGEVTGTLEVEQEGLMTVFSADCRDDGDLIRLSVFDGAGKAGYLGVMLPEDGRLSLVKRLSRAGMADFPTEIVCAGTVWEAPQPELQPEPEPEPETAPAEIEEAAAAAETVLAQEAEPEAVIWKRQPNPWSLFSEPGMKAALCSVRGALTATEAGAVLLAIPTSMDGIGLSERILEAGELRTIDGTEYAVFRL